MLVIQTFLFLLISALKTAESGFNVAYRKETRANVTCGYPAEIFYETQQGLLDQDRVPFVCNASDPSKAYPPENIVDGSLGTHWQSTADMDAVSIEISLGQAFYVQDIDITFGNYRRPGAIKVEKSTDFGATFFPWHYLVTSPASSRCDLDFGVQASTMIVEVDQVLCEEYTRYFPPEYNETVSIKFNHMQRGDGSFDPFTPGILVWMNVTSVKFSFSGLYRKFDSISTAWHHYTVREIVVTGRCHCNGHGDGNQCPFNQSEGRNICQCQGNTCGENCESCCPLYNQFPWKQGSGAPWNIDPSAKCEPCNCHNHADSCLYNQTVSDLGLSMSMNGTMLGGGVCINCKHNTRGINCERCEDLFYRPLAKNQTDIDACYACNCNISGVNNTTNLPFGNCVRDESALSDHPGKQPGDCYCKEFVEGRQCDRCKAGYYRLTQENSQGCVDCACHPEGTENRSSICQEDYFGQCPCKTNVDLRNCNQCKDGFYDLQDWNSEGCKSCHCHVGGTASGALCNKVTGACHCRPRVTGRTCNRTESGFYFPDTHFINGARSPYKPPTSTLNVVLNIPKTGAFRLLVVFTIGDSTEVEGQIIMQFTSNSGLPSGNVSAGMFNFTHRFQQCDNCPEDFADSVSLREGQWTVDISAVQPDANLKLERAIAIPLEFITAEVLPTGDSKEFTLFCNPIANDMSGNDRCIPWLFSITMDYLNGGLACACNPLGSTNETCEQYGGQCSCKSGVEGRDCGRCKPGFYNLTDKGCTPCGCNGPNQVCNVTTGECECPNNTVGRTCIACECNNNSDKCLRSGECLDCQFNTTGEYCQHCKDGWFGNATDQHCNACACNQTGSLSQVCDRVSGKCNCKTKVTGRDCSICAENTFGFGPSGCQDCQCNQYGSASLQCSPSGKCSCRANVTGEKCSQCFLGSYGLPEMPCIECGCDASGTVPGTFCNSDTTGQCECKTGVTGRSCDRCARFYANFSHDGCSECSPCIQNLRQLIINNTIDINTTDVKLLELRGLLALNEPITQTTSSLQHAKVEREHFYARIAAGYLVYEELISSKIPETNLSLLELANRAEDLSVFSEEAALNTTNTLQDVMEETQRTLTTGQLVTSIAETIGDVRTAVTGYRSDGTQILADSSQIVDETMKRNFTQYWSNISESTRIAENMSALVDKASTMTLSQTSLAQELEFEVAAKAFNFTQTQEVENQAHDQFMNELDQVYNKTEEAWSTMTESKNILSQELEVLNNTQNSLKESNRKLNETEATLFQTNSIFEDLSHVGRGNVTLFSELNDTSNLLQEEIEKAKSDLVTTEIMLLQAQNRTSSLLALVQTMERIFNGSRERGIPPMSALQRYSEIHEELNISLSLLQDARKTMDNITAQLIAVPLEQLRNNSDRARLTLFALYNSSLERNSTVFNLERIIYDANMTVLEAVSTWQRIHSQIPAIEQAAASLQAAATRAPEAIPATRKAQNAVNNTRLLLENLDTLLTDMDTHLKILLDKITFIRNAPFNGTRLIDEAFTNVWNASIRVVSNSEPPINVTIRNAQAVMASLSPLRDRIEANMNNVTSKLTGMKDVTKSLSLSLALRLVNESSLVFAAPARKISNPAANEVSFDIRINATNGILLFIVGQPRNGTNERSDWWTASLGFIILNSTVQVLLDFDNGPITLQNPLLLNNTWHNVYFTSIGDVATLTVSASAEVRETVSINVPSDGAAGRTLQFANESNIYIGGFPPNKMESLTSLYGYFNGIMDNLIINKQRYNLLNPDEAFGDWRFASPRFIGTYYPVNGMAATFYGNGFLQHAMGRFNTDRGNFAVELGFRTLERNGIIMAVTDAEERYICVIFLQDGKVQFYFVFGAADAITLKTSSSSYGNGRWYRVRAMRTSQNATLTVNPVGSLLVPDSSFVETGEMTMPSGQVITFGALFPNSLVAFVESAVFAGDMKNLKLSETGSSTLVPRRFNDPETVLGRHGVSYNGVIKGKIEYGTRFYGYLEEERECSFAAVDVTSPNEAISSLTFTFKTKEQSGVLLWSANNTQDTVQLYLRLFHGDLELVLGEGTFKSSNISFTNNIWHVIHLNFTDAGYSLYINNTLVDTSEFSTSSLPLVLTRPFYMGGLPQAQFPDLFLPCFKGGMKSLIIDSRSVSLLSERSIGVSKAGVVPAIVPPPSCGPPLAPPTKSSSNRRVHFDLHASGDQKYIGFNLAGNRSSMFEVKFVVSLWFRALLPDGVLLYATDNDTHPTQFFSLELIHGRLRYQFNSGAGLVSMVTNDVYSGNGQWYEVHFLRVQHMGAVLTSTNDYANGHHTSPYKEMKLHRLYIGAVPSHVVAPYLFHRDLGFAGCISNFEVNNLQSLLDLSNPDMRGSNSGNGRCFEVALPGLGFNGTAWARYDNFNLTADFEIDLTFRTSSRDGILFAINGNISKDHGEEMSVLLEQSRGQVCAQTIATNGTWVIILTYNTTENATRLVWTKQGDGNESYLVCQMDWHSVRIVKNGPNITVELDELPSVTGLVANSAEFIDGHLFLGGYPHQRYGGNATVSSGLVGCLKSFSLNGNLLHFARAVDLANVMSACAVGSK